MITKIGIHNFGPLTKVEWNNIPRINLILGSNGAGKTFLLKSLYTAMRTLEEYKRGNSPRSAAQILLDKLYWTFQVGKIGNLVSRGSKENLSFKCQVDEHELSYSFSRGSSKQIKVAKDFVGPKTSNSIFIPSREILSLQPIILESRYIERKFGFDDAYSDLARALEQPPHLVKSPCAYLGKVSTQTELAELRKKIDVILGGRMEYEVMEGVWLFRGGKGIFPIDAISEGARKIATLGILIDNHYLNRQSTVFIENPESSLHPSTLIDFLDIVYELSKQGIQIFLTSHSYFVIKKLYLISQKNNISINVLTLDGGTGYQSDLRDGIPDSEIINESIELYKQEVDLEFL